jgi:hypothetical protein
MIISCSVPVRMGNVADKICRENENTHFIFNPPPKKKSFRIWDMWKDVVEPDRTDGGTVHALCILDV